ncbi:metal-dependent hydrolase [Myxococcota bacterium]|nr:metal-dependent hydrolase [Myxococcota bacterium]
MRPPPPLPVVRAPRFDLSTLPRWYNGGSALATHLMNGLNFVFPAGERFFIRSVRFYIDRVEDPQLKAAAVAFVAQEAQHQRAHLQAFGTLESQGFEIRSYLDWYERLAYEIIEPRCPPSLRLAATAALEHLTAIFGELALGTTLLEPTHPEMRRLLRWHAAEEIEHRHVAFDVFEAVDGRYLLRATGMLVALSTLFFFWAVGARHLLRQETTRPPAEVERAARQRVRSFWWGVSGLVARRVLDWFRPGFHPADAEIDQLAADYVASMA